MAPLLSMHPLLGYSFKLLVATAIAVILLAAPLKPQRRRLGLTLAAVIAIYPAITNTIFMVNAS